MWLNSQIRKNGTKAHPIQFVRSGFNDSPPTSSGFVRHPEICPERWNTVVRDLELELISFKKKPRCGQVTNGKQHRQLMLPATHSDLPTSLSLPSTTTTTTQTRNICREGLVLSKIVYVLAHLGCASLSTPPPLLDLKICPRTGSGGLPTE